MKSPKKKCRSLKNHHYIDGKKDTCLQYDNMRTETRKQCIALSDLNWESVCRATRSFSALPMSTNDYERAMSVDFEITNKF